MCESAHNACRCRVLDEHDWTRREQRHRERVDGFLRSFRAPASAPHPVWDFLFTYYSLRPRQLRTWHPGFGVALAGDAAARYLGRSGYGRTPAGVTVSREYLTGRADTVRFIAGLLRATVSRPARLNCFGLHEWAMVYRAPTVRHERVPLRLGAAGTDAVVESMPLRCSHFDAFRFFTKPATERNSEQLTRDGQVGSEQPGCLHAAMDCYKFAYKLGPLVDSALVMDCLELATQARELDMRASPYDLRDYGFEPIAIETPAGRSEYVRIQQHVAEQAAPLRERLTKACEQLLAAVDRASVEAEGTGVVHEGTGAAPAATSELGAVTRG
ncbi:3-methyladenine DNA glycosylase [Mycolicibacterium gadium]|uniref:3-methyladenine DNA glycosylase n=1 Tax=Mycolicibacterium gadium TaxID=1794 RepID=A0ABT6GR00_MYCGU|nr:3-methyladenine DNA glycosylase [Mycolicibacterium gadium]MDG5483495.1 3-methyladenine DNA glycosylase [Mycolicibacterium gadium]